MTEENTQLPKTEREAFQEFNEKLAERRQACLKDLTAAINAVCSKYNCRFDVKMTIHGDGRVEPIVDVIPLPEGQIL